MKVINMIRLYLAIVTTLQILLTSCSVESVEPVESVESNAEVFFCDTVSPVPTVTLFEDDFEGTVSRWGPAYTWGYDADKNLYPTLDSNNDGLGDTIQHLPWPEPKYPSVNTPAIQVTDGVLEGIVPRSGMHSVKFTVQPGDISSNGNRSELSLFKSQDPQCSEAWYGWSMLIPIDYSPPTTGLGFQTVGDWHSQPDPSNPNATPGQAPIGLNIVHANHISNTTGKDLLVMNSKRLVNGVIVRQRVFEQEINFGDWNDLILHVKWSTQSDGFFEVWYRNVPDPTNVTDSYTQLIFSDTGTTRYEIPTIVNQIGNFFKIGLYRSTEPEKSDTTGIVYYDEVRRGNSFTDVSLSPKTMEQ